MKTSGEGPEGGRLFLDETTEPRPAHRRIILFERIRHMLYPMILWYIWRGYEVEYLQADPHIPKSPVLGKYHRNGRIRRFASGPYDFRAQMILNRNVTGAIDDLYGHGMEHSGPVRAMRDLFRSPFVDLVYKKALALELAARARNAFLASRAARERPGGERLAFFPEAQMSGAGYSPLPGRLTGEDQAVDIPRGVRGIHLLSYYGAKIAWLSIFALFPIWILGRIGVPSLSRRERQEFHLGIRVYRTDIGFQNRIRTIDFILDGTHLHAGSTIFCLETGVSGQYLESLEKRNYHYVELGKILRNADLHFIRTVIIGKFLPAWFSAALHGISSSPLALRTTLEAFDRYLTWTRFFACYGVHDYISYNDFQQGNTVRNLVFHANGVETYYYIHSSHFFNVFLPLDAGEFQTVEFMYLFFDHLISWGDKVTRAFRSPYNLIGEYHPVGCLWSEHVREIIEAGRAGVLREEVFRRVAERSGGVCTKIIAVYDTSFGDGLPLQSRDIIGFIEGILGLLDLFPDVALVFKNKNPWEEIFGASPETRPYYDRARTDPRCFAAGDLGITSEEIIAASDLCLAACFTAPATEALGARKKALYFDATGRFRGSYYDQFHRLVAHSPEELNRFAAFWINEISDEEFSAFLDTRIRGKVDACVDGRAITRFRRLLCPEGTAGDP